MGRREGGSAWHSTCYQRCACTLRKRLGSSSVILIGGTFNQYQKTFESCCHGNCKLTIKQRNGIEGAFSCMLRYRVGRINETTPFLRMPITIDTVPPVTTWANSFPVLCSIWCTPTLAPKPLSDESGYLSRQ